MKITQYQIPPKVIDPVALPPEAVENTGSAFVGDPEHGARNPQDKYTKATDVEWYEVYDAAGHIAQSVDLPPQDLEVSARRGERVHEYRVLPESSPAFQKYQEVAEPSPSVRGSIISIKA